MSLQKLNGIMLFYVAIMIALGSGLYTLNKPLGDQLQNYYLGAGAGAVIALVLWFKFGRDIVTGVKSVY
jgi:NhaP-type Na+/H+ or K+/H+ antiporter